MIVDFQMNSLTTVTELGPGTWSVELTAGDNILGVSIGLEIKAPTLDIRKSDITIKRDVLGVIPEMFPLAQKLIGVRVGPGMTKIVRLYQVDFLANYALDKDYDSIVSQRFLINLMEWELQQKVLLDLMGMLKKGGKLVMLEGCVQGVEELNLFRSYYGLEPIPVKWHNLFFDCNELKRFMSCHGFRFIEEDGLGDYFLLTRGVRPIFDSNITWDTPYNKTAASQSIRKLLHLRTTCSRLKLWVFSK